MGNVLAVSSSPRRNGNSELLLNSFRKGVEDKGHRVWYVRLNTSNFSLCQACDLCAEDGECILEDDLQEVYEQVARASGIVLATPVYFGSMSAQLKMFVERFQGWWHAKYNLKRPRVKSEENRPGFFICVGALKKKSYCENALEIARVFYHNVNYRYYDCLFYRGVDDKGAIKSYPGALQEARSAGQRFAGELPAD